MLNLIEKIVLLAIKNENGKVSGYARNFIGYGVAGAIILELAELGKIEIRNKKLYIIDESPSGDTILDEAINIIVTPKRPKSVNSWVYSNTKLKKMARNEAINKFVQNGVMKEEHKKFLGLFTMKRYPITNPYEKSAMEQKLREVLLSSNSGGDIKDILLVSLMAVCGSVQLVLSKEERKGIKNKLKLIAKGKYFDVENEVLIKTLKAISSAIAAQSAVAVGAGV